MSTQHRRNVWWLLAIATLLAVMAAALGGAAEAADPPASPAAARGTARGELRDAMLATPSVERGEELFAPCGACHGADGRGVADGSVPVIAGQHYTIVVKQLVDYRHNRRWDIQMEHAAKMQHLAGGRDLADLGAFVAKLPRGFPAGIGNGENLGAGARAYFERCEGCHGPLGEGDEAHGYPRIAGQHYAYLYRQFFDAIEQRRPVMSALHLKLMVPLSREQITGISDYLSRTSIELTHAPD